MSRSVIDNFLGASQTKVVIVTKDKAPAHAPMSAIGEWVLGMYSMKVKSGG